MTPADRERLVTENLRLCDWTVNRALRHVWDGTFQPDERDDLVQEARLGLMRAAVLFDPTRGVRFGTFAFWHIRQRVGRAMDRWHRVIPPPADPDVFLFLPDWRPEPPEQVALAESAEVESSAVEHALSTLHPRQAFVLRRRLMEGALLREVADELGVTRERVRQMQKTATRALVKRNPHLEALAR